MEVKKFADATMWTEENHFLPNVTTEKVRIPSRFGFSELEHFRLTHNRGLSTQRIAYLQKHVIGKFVPNVERPDFAGSTTGNPTEAWKHWLTERLNPRLRGVLGKEVEEGKAEYPDLSTEGSRTNTPARWGGNRAPVEQAVATVDDLSAVEARVEAPREDEPERRLSRHSREVKFEIRRSASDE